MKKVMIQTKKPYTVYIKPGLLPQVGALLSEVKKPCKAAVISDDTVFSLYGDTVLESLSGAGFSTVSFIFPHGESSKTFSVAEAILNFLAENQVTRGDIIVALGGGVTGDLAGFAASMYLRGIDFVQIPTTLLAAIDSSVGGKTGVNLQAGKNLAGAFLQPLAVFCDPDTLGTLPESVFKDGLAEAVKYGAIGDNALFSSLYNNMYDLAELIASCVDSKRRLVEEDEFDTGMRQLLNFGHTAGHAIEALSFYEVSHGQAVAIGMCIVSKACDKLGISKEPCGAAIEACLRNLGIDTCCSFSPADLAAVALRDKKRTADSVSLVVLDTLGQAILRKTAVSELSAFFAAGLD